MPGKDIPHADGLSRLKFQPSPLLLEDTIAAVDDFNFSVLQPEEIRQDILVDPIIQEVMRRVVSGNWNGHTKAEEVFYRVRDALTIEDGILFYGTRAYVPPSLRRKCFKSAHDTHQGQNSTLYKLKKSI